MTQRILNPWLIVSSLLMACAGLPAQPVGLGNDRDLVLVSSLDGGSLTDAAKLSAMNQMLSVTVSSPQGARVGAPVLLAVDFRHRADWSVIAAPGEPLALGIGPQFFIFAQVPALGATGFTYAASIPDLNILGDVALWIQAAALDPLAPNGYAITRTVRHDPQFLESVDNLSSTEFNAGTRYGYAIETANLMGGAEDELLVSLPGADPGGISEAGFVRILDGTGLTVLQTLEAPLLQAGAWFGSSLASGDVTGDGVADVVVGARYEDEAGVQDAGAAYVFAGPAFTTVTRLVSPSPEGSARFGHAIAVADWTGDGISDVVVGAPRETSGGLQQAGRVYVFPGPSFAGPLTIENPGPQAWSKFGYAVAAGDLDGAGGDDLVITTPFHDVSVNDDTGRAHIFLSPATVPVIAIEQPEDAFALLGTDVCLGDFDRDGHLDVAVSAEFDDEGAFDGGSVHILHGPTFTSSLEVASPSPAVGAGFGSAVAAGDVNADGYDDLVIGEFWREVSGVSQAGKGWCLFGPHFAQSSDFEAAYPGTGDQVGRRVAVGDLDGDRYADPIMGAPFASPAGQSTEGEVHVIRQ